MSATIPIKEGQGKFLSSFFYNEKKEKKESKNDG